jgi:endonuclease-8
VPEGDTIRRAALRLDEALGGQVVATFEASRLRPPFPIGARVDEVDAVGKHLYMRFGDGSTLHSHMGLHGSWHVYRVGERWQRSRAQDRIVITTVEGMIAACFAPQVLELYAPGVDPGRDIAHLGPDLIRPGVDIDVVVARIDTVVDADTDLGLVLLDQRVAAGVGNVFKSEVCFAVRRSPWDPIASLDREARVRLYATAAQQLQANLETRRRTTVPEGLAVYGRSGKPCRVCGTAIEWRRQGEDARSTYWCPQCQPRVS